MFFIIGVINMLDDIVLLYKLHVFRVCIDNYLYLFRVCECRKSL